MVEDGKRAEIDVLLLPLNSKGSCGSPSRARCLLYILSFQERILSKMRSGRVLLAQHTAFCPKTTTRNIAFRIKGPGHGSTLRLCASEHIYVSFRLEILSGVCGR